MAEILDCTSLATTVKVLMALLDAPRIPLPVGSNIDQMKRDLQAAVDVCLASPYKLDYYSDSNVFAACDQGMTPCQSDFRMAGR